MILAGNVLVNGQKVEKAGAGVEADADFFIRLLGEALKYVSRGGLKLERALEYWKIDVTGKVVSDVGASTGGFTDCLLQHGAARVIGVDTGHGQIDFPRLRQDPARASAGKDQCPLSDAGSIGRGCGLHRDGRFLHLGNAGASCGNYGRVSLRLHWDGKWWC